MDKDRIEGNLKERLASSRATKSSSARARRRTSWGKAKDSADDAWDKGKDAVDDAKDSLDRRI